VGFKCDFVYRCIQAHSFWMRELQSSGQTKVQRTLNVPERLVYALYNWRGFCLFSAKGVTGSMAYDIMLAVVII